MNTSRRRANAQEVSIYHINVSALDTAKIRLEGEHHEYISTSCKCTRSISLQRSSIGSVCHMLYKACRLSPLASCQKLKTWYD